MVARLRSWALAVWHFVSNAPLTYAWLVVLVITTIIQNNLTGSQLHFVLLHRSTNIAELGRDPLEVLFSSLLWIDGRNLEPYLLLFTRSSARRALARPLALAHRGIDRSHRCHLFERRPALSGDPAPRRLRKDGARS
ncbi:transmembrane protein [Mycobacterium tuberculosis]|nr:transmembrane protein [Mycobacterium tuberculosis]